MGSRTTKDNFDKSIAECSNCRKLGHFEWECHSKKNNPTKISKEMLLMAHVGQLQEKGLVVLIQQNSYNINNIT